MEKIKEIKVSGRIYGAGEKLEIFIPNNPDNPTTSWCTIYGKNGPPLKGFPGIQAEF